MKKFIKKRPLVVAINEDAKAEVKAPSLSDNLTPSPRERRDMRRHTALDEAEKSVALRHNKEKKNG